MPRLSVLRSHLCALIGGVFMAIDPNVNLCFWFKIVLFSRAIDKIAPKIMFYPGLSAIVKAAQADSVQVGNNFNRLVACPRSV